MSVFSGSDVLFSNTTNFHVLLHWAGSLQFQKLIRYGMVLSGAHKLCKVKALFFSVDANAADAQLRNCALAAQKRMF